MFDFFMNDFWNFTLSVQQRCLMLTALRETKKLLVNRWNPPHRMDRRTWTVYLLDIISMELSTSLIHGSNVKTVNSWHSAFNVVIFSKIFAKIILLLIIYLLI